MKSFIWLAVFALAVIAVYMLFIIAYVPDQTPQAPPEAASYDPSKMTDDDIVMLGMEVYGGRGSCRLCHNRVGLRAPLIDNIAVTAADRIKDPGYRGRAVDAVGYIYESMTEPSAYVVPGYGMKGTGGTKSPMPDVSSGAIRLSELEMLSVIAYLQKTAGLPMTVKIPGRTPPAGERRADEAR